MSIVMGWWLTMTVSVVLYAKKQEILDLCYGIHTVLFMRKILQENESEI